MALTIDQKLDNLALNVQDVKNRLDMQQTFIVNQINNAATGINNNITRSNVGLVNQISSTQNNITTTINQRIGEVSSRLNTVTTNVTNNVTNAINGATANINRHVDDSLVHTGESIGRISIDIQKKVDSVSQAIQQKENAVQIAIQQKLDGVLHDVQLKIDASTAPILADVTKASKTTTDNLTNLVNNLGTSVKTATTNTDLLVKSTADKLNNSIQQVIDATKNLSSGIITDANNSGVPISSSQILQNIKSHIGMSSFFDLSSIESFLGSLQTYVQTNQPTPDNPFGGGDFTLNIKRQAQEQADRKPHTTFTLFSDLGDALQEQIDAIKIIIERTTRGDFKTLEQFNNEFKRIGVDGNFISGILQLLPIIPTLFEVGKLFTSAFTERIQQLIERQYELQLMDEGNVLLAFIRNQIPVEDAIERLRELGHPDKDANIILRNSFPKYNANELFRLGYLGKFNGDDIKKRMREIGWNDIDTILHGYLLQPRPDIRDLIQFAVKEVYSPETYLKFGQYQEFPQRFAEEAKLLGLSEDYAKQYWAQHWQLPSATMGFDMFHRGIINHDDLASLLKALDVMPFWREKLINLAYNVVTRVDVRRMYAYKIYTKQQVYEAYIKEGYSPKDATDLTNFTVKYDAEQDNKHKTKLQATAYATYLDAYTEDLITKDAALNEIIKLGYDRNETSAMLDIMKYKEYVTEHQQKKVNHRAKLANLSFNAYRKGTIPKSDLVANLVSIGYSASDANAEANYTDQESNVLFKEQVSKLIEQQYYEGFYTDNELIAELTSQGFTNAEAMQTLKELSTLRKYKAKKPTQQQAEKMFKNGILSEQQYRQYLLDDGWNTDYIEQLVQLGQI